MEKLNYSIEDSTIAEILGIQNFSTEESAVLELVKNAYDAGAQQVTLEFSKNSLVITDDGKGMDADDIKHHWMHVGKSDKGYEICDEKGNKRILAGAKGIGRFALARLGKNIKFESKKVQSTGVVWTTDWNATYLEENPSIESEGSRIIINELREKWGKKKIQNLCEFLSKTYNDDAMKITICYEGICEEVLPYFPEPVLGQNCLSIIHVRYDSLKQKVYTHVTSDEFQKEAQKYCPGIDINEMNTEVKAIDNLEIKMFDFTKEEIVEFLSSLGDFSAQLYFSIKPTKMDKDKFLYRHMGLSEDMKSGIILYRNAFGISTYEGQKDWLELGKRSRKSPAAASHPTGNWRVRENQLSGSVEIDKENNKVLKEISNRQGIEDDVYYKLFIQIICIGISEFERYRQSIIRLIDKKNKVNTEKTTPITESIIKNPANVGTLSKQETLQLVDELKSFQQESSSFKKTKEDIENRYKYDVRILNVLSTVGLKAASIAHEMRNDRNLITDNIENIIEALQEYGMWEELNSPERTVTAYNNVPYLLELNEKVNKKIVSFMNVMLYEIEKKQFKPGEKNVKDTLENIVDNWRRDYTFTEITVNIDENILLNISDDILQVIFDNLILNSIQQNENRNALKIMISALKVNEGLLFNYSDDGKGLDSKYHDNPWRILEVHETTRETGHGLGMWIVNNTINMANGHIEKIVGDKGFNIEFFIGKERL